ncbi:chemotaxis protein CheA [Hyphomicrobium sp.]|uniref:chemotaxis protein CheA n=1 Tax=Hyphomicrobium sp. TaxID=82 RepID=UPI000FB88EFB|nr:chemotaxis protein CheA [Hyphomicrobium sp.]RUO97529.1 MAG: chemotaxis protein CheA [Hyphomicrobium sp.]
MTGNTEAIETFRVEAAELLERIEQGLLDLSRKPGDRALVDEVFRSLHTLKGSGAMFGFDALASFTHHCETAFDKVRKGEVVATPNLVSVVLAAQDHMRTLLGGGAGDDAVGKDLLGRLEREVAIASGSAGPEPADKTEWTILFTLPPNALVNGCNPLALLAEMRELGDCTVIADVSDVPPLDALVANECYVSWRVTLHSDRPRTEIEDVFMFIIDDMKLEIQQAGSKAIEPAASTAVDVPAEVSSPVPASRQAESRSLPKGGESVRVPAERLDELMDRVGELVIAQSRLSQIAAASPDLNLRAVSEDIERLSNELRNTMMVLRMVPVGTLFSRFRRLVHDLARDTGKSIELTTEGEATEVDKTVIERLADPLVHLVRNSIDHGLETPDQRKTAGKPETGQVRLAAQHAGGEVVITITDDGRGIDRGRVRAKAEAQGLIVPNAQLSDQELLQLIFQPGFSTAQTITNLSGRGVGMDVVKRTVEALRGSIDLTSKPGVGSEVSLRIPLTLAIIDGLLVRVGKGRYVIPLSAVEECLELPVEQDMRSRGRSFISLRDSLVPFLRLRELFQTGTEPDRYQKVVVVSTGSERVGLVVDQIIGDHQTVIKAMSKLHEDVAMFSGATILGDGAVALILDIPHLVETGQNQEAQLRKAG